MRIVTGVTLCMLLVTAAALRAGARAASPDRQAVDPLPRALEVKLALSAAPPYLRSEATVYVLDPAKGYWLERRGTNGFTCYIQRTDYTRAFYRADYLVPECQGPEGTDAIVPVEFDIERLRAEGTLTPQELKEEIGRRFRDGVYHAPGRPGVAYMLAPVAQLNGGPGGVRTVPMNMPHVMYFAPNQTSRDFGGGAVMGPYPYLVNAGPMAYIILHVGEAEKAQINRESRDLLAELCAYRSYLCLDGIGTNHHAR
jgi:hypothetical protein